MNTPAETLTKEERIALSKIGVRHERLRGVLLKLNTDLPGLINSLKLIRANKSYRPGTYRKFVKDLTGLSESYIYRLLKGNKKNRYKQNIPSALRWDVWVRDNFTCKQCGSRRFLEIDHEIPESDGGPTTLENLRTLCRTCNRDKGSKDPVFYRTVYQPLQILESFGLHKSRK